MTAEQVSHPNPEPSPPINKTYLRKAIDVIRSPSEKATYGHLCRFWRVIQFVGYDRPQCGHADINVIEFRASVAVRSGSPHRAGTRA